MKRLCRIIFNALAALSLLLCIITAVLWVRSYAYEYLLRLRLDAHRSISITSVAGYACFGTEDEGPNRETGYFSLPIPPEYRHFWAFKCSRVIRTWGKA